MSRQKSSKAIKNLGKAPLTRDDLTAFTAELLHGTDRATALVGCALIDAEITEALTSIFVHRRKEDLEQLITSPNSPLSTLSAKIKIMFALGVVNEKVFDSLNTIREIRNIFAHSMRPLVFTTPEISAECAKLILPKKVDWPLSTTLSVPKEQYVAACLSIAQAMPKVKADFEGRKILWSMKRQVAEAT
jgi:DNA-binding MltR family transcriptional regulator